VDEPRELAHHQASDEERGARPGVVRGEQRETRDTEEEIRPAVVQQTPAERPGIAR
jgi:hypothetical protein